MALSVGAIVGISVASVLGVVAIAIGIFICCKWRQIKEDEESCGECNEDSPRQPLLAGDDNQETSRDRLPWSERRPHTWGRLSSSTQRLIEEREARGQIEPRQHRAHGLYGTTNRFAETSRSVQQEKRSHQEEKPKEPKPKKRKKGWKKKWQNFKDNLEGKDTRDDPELKAKIREMEDHIRIMRENEGEDEERNLERLEKLERELAEIRARREK